MDIFRYKVLKLQNLIYTESCRSIMTLKVMTGRHLHQPKNLCFFVDLRTKALSCCLFLHWSGKTLHSLWLSKTTSIHEYGKVLSRAQILCFVGLYVIFAASSNCTFCSALTNCLFVASVFWNWNHLLSTGKSEALIFVSSNQQYDNRLFIVHENCKLRIPAEHAVYTKCCFCFVLTFRTILVHNIF
jgi:hypothetical protein